MFARVLLDNDEWYLTLNWFGFGRLEATHWPSERHAIASPQLKSHFLHTIEALQRQGEAVRPDNQTLQRAFALFASLVIDPDDLISRATLIDDPEALAWRIAAGIE